MPPTPTLRLGDFLVIARIWKLRAGTIADFVGLCGGMTRIRFSSRAQQLQLSLSPLAGDTIAAIAVGS